MDGDENSLNNNEHKVMRYETQILINPSKMSNLNPQFSLCDILLCYHGENRNGTKMSKEVIEDALPSLYGIPIIGEYIYMDDGSQDFGSHGGRIVWDEDGIRYEDTTRPFGFITKEAVEKASWITVTEKDGHTQHEYLQLKGCILWTERYEEAKKILDKNYGQSMEITVSKSRYIEGESSRYICNIEKFVFSAACILGHRPDGMEVIPCFESANITRHYEFGGFKAEYDLMFSKFKEYEATKEAALKNIANGGTGMDLKKFTDVLSQMKISDTENDKYLALNADSDKVYVLDMEDYKLYSLEYADVTDEASGETNTVISYDSKSEVALCVAKEGTENVGVTFDSAQILKTTTDAIVEGQVTKVKNELTAQLTSQFDAQVQALNDNFNEKIEKTANDYKTLSDSFAVASKKLAEYEASDKEQKAIEHKAEIEEVFKSFSEKLAHNSEFLIYKAKCNPADTTAEKVREDLTLIVGKQLMNEKAKKNFNYEPNVADFGSNGQSNRSKNEVSNRYGHLLDKYMN